MQTSPVIGVECPAEAGVNLWLHFLGELGPFYVSVYLLVNKETPFGGDWCSGFYRKPGDGFWVSDEKVKQL